MNQIKTCNNNCIFCFVNQLPKNLRESLYIKDDDYLLSFMYSNFVTLTNLKKKDLDRIIKSRLEPLYVSVHSLDKRIRNIMFGTKKQETGLKNFKILDENGIKTHLQIVLCPGINDGIYLKKTLEGLIEDYKNILSIGIVPVGITKYNKCKKLKPVGKFKAIETIKLLESFNNEFKSHDKIFLSDEFYLIGQRDFPSYDSYHSFPQIMNGIGKCADFLNKIRKNLYLVKKDNIGIVTSEYGSKVFEEIKKIFEEKNIAVNFRIIKIKNNFLGGNVKVTGLMAGSDLKYRLTAISKSFDKILIPDSIFNQDKLTLDDYNIRDIKKISKNIKIIPEDAKSLLKEL